MKKDYNIIPNKRTDGIGGLYNHKPRILLRWTRVSIIAHSQSMYLDYQ